MGTSSIKETLFSECVAHAENNYGGGGIEMLSPQRSPHIESCTFISCSSGDDAGGLGIWSSSFYQETCVNECRFIECQINHTTSSDGGSLLIWYSSAAIGCSDTLFAHSHSDYRGGAVSCYITSDIRLTSSLPLFSFCFFTDNTCNAGNDAFIVEWVPTVPFLHSLSTSSETRVYSVSDANNRWDDNFYENSDTWLPFGILSYLNTWDGTNDP